MLGEVSTHAPLQDVTSSVPDVHIAFIVSTHAPLQDVTGSLCRMVHFSLIVFIFQDA